MQEINGVRDKLRIDVEGLDGGYTTIARIMKTSTQNVHKALQTNNQPRLATLEKVRVALDQAKRLQKVRIQQLTA